MQFLLTYLINQILTPSTNAELQFLQRSHQKPITLPESTKCELRIPENTKTAQTQKTLPNNSTEFLVPLLKWGPTNQVYGFFESAQLAFILNRTLVIPPMYQHHTIRNSGNSRIENLNIPIGIRVNIEEISRNQKVTDFESYNKFCPETTTAFMTAQRPAANMDRIYDFLDATNYTFKKFDKLTKYQSKIQNDVGPYETVRDRCVVYVLPYRSMKNPEIDILATKNNKILEKFSPSIDFPDFVKELSEEFSLEYFGFGIHWRFNKNDWGSRCKFKKPPAECEIREEMSNVIAVSKVLLKQINAIDLAHKSVYISCPPSEIEFIKLVGDSLRVFDENLEVKSTADMFDFLKENRKLNTCRVGLKYFDEILSVVEQSLLTQVEHFLSWPVSSWSGRVHQLRNPPVHITYEGIQVRERNFTLVDLLVRNVGSIHEEF